MFINDSISTISSTKKKSINKLSNLSPKRDIIKDFLNPPKMKNEKSYYSNFTPKHFKPISIRKIIDLKKKKIKKYTKPNFDFTNIEFSDNFPSKNLFSEFYKKKIFFQEKKINFEEEKIVFSNEKLLENNKDKVRILNLQRFLFTKNNSVYDCCFCDKRFLKHTALGGHISKFHKKKKKKQFQKKKIQKINSHQNLFKKP